MELIINELSFHPLAESSTHVESRFKGLIKTFEKAKNEYGFSHMCFPQNYPNIQVTAKETLIQWITNLQRPIIKDLILGLCKKPFMDDLEEEELNEFYKSTYVIVGNVPTNETPYGLPVAHIKSLPAISINSHEFWNNRRIILKKSNIQIEEDTEFFVYNLCQENDAKEKELTEWANKSFLRFIKDDKTLSIYLNYSKYSISYRDAFIEQLMKWKNNDDTIYKHVLRLMKDVELHPFTGGIGKTENLKGKGKGKEASKRITQEDRLSYTLENNNVHFIACEGHYKFD